MSTAADSLNKNETVNNSIEKEVTLVDNQSELNENDDVVPSIVQKNESSKAGIPNGVEPKPTLLLVPPNQVADDPSGYDNNAGVQYRRSRPASRPVSRSGSVLESKSPGFINTRLVNYNRGVSYQPSMHSHSHYHPEPENIPPPSTEEEKSKTTRRYFATIFAITYAMFLVIFGTIAFVGSAVHPQYLNAAEIFCIFMLTVGFCYFIFLFIDIRLHVKKAKKAVKDKEYRLKMLEEEMARTEALFQNSMQFSSQNGLNNVNLQIPLPNLSANPIPPVSHRYCFKSGRHGEFLYLKLGAAWFCFGLLTHSILTLTYQIVYFTQDSDCSNLYLLTVEIMFPLYSLFLLFFIFKYCNIVINSYRGLARLMLMHAIGTSLAFWIYTIVRETQDAINMKNYLYSNKYNTTDTTEPLSTVRIRQMTDPSERFSADCPGQADLNTIYRNFAPYLYPFIIEFCILIVGIFYMIWANINHCPKKLSASGHGHDNHGSPQHGHSLETNNFTSLGSIPEEGQFPSSRGAANAPPSEVSDHCNNLVEHEYEYKSNIVVYADCHAASRGLFGGMVLMILTIVFIILLHVAVNEPSYVETGIMIDSIFELSILLLLIVMVVAAYFQTSKLDINLHPMSKLDDVLLFIAIPAFFSETIFSMLPAVINGSYLNIAVITAQLLQVMIQTPWIIDSLRRCSNSMELRKKKPGRELVTFLTIANVSLWVFYTFSVKNADTQDERYSFYGDVLWSILNHLSLPLIMFYRFHASVCLVDIWRHSYEPGEFAH